MQCPLQPCGGTYESGVTSQPLSSAVNVQVHDSAARCMMLRLKIRTQIRLNYGLECGILPLPCPQQWSVRFLELLDLDLFTESS